MFPAFLIVVASQAASVAVSETNLAGAGVESEILTMIFKAGPMVKSIMGILLLASLISWAISFFKFFQLARANRQSDHFLNSFYKTRSLANLFSEATDYHDSPISRIFRVGYQELGRAHKARLETRAAMENVQRALRRAASAESVRLYRYLPFLASCGNATPFIGLFGTVWGIMGSFHEIGLKGTANLANVAPGISEALVATAAGLATAIPAVIFFNYFNSRVRIVESEMSNFMADFVNYLERDFLKRSQGQQES
ncbi:MAG: protein TolQ [Deltaproteobacteria bacterium]|jgi:biopolymer transport protein TolQ|nr:protein TolQ [Deltaproteobacteria bacterium]